MNPRHSSGLRSVFAEWLRALTEDGPLVCESMQVKVRMFSGCLIMGYRVAFALRCCLPGQFPSELFGVPLQTLMAPFASCQRQTEVQQVHPCDCSQ